LRGPLLGLSVCFAVAGFGLGSAAVASADSCPNAVFRNGPSSRLPDCRAYEMVTPPYKEGFPVGNEGLVKLERSGSFTEDGSHVWGDSLGVFAGAEQDQFDTLLGGYYSEGAAYVFSRGESGWTTTPDGPSEDLYPYAVMFALNGDFSSSLWLAVSNAQELRAEAAGAEALAVASFYVHSGNGPLVEVGPMLPPSANGGFHFDFAGASEDLSVVLYELTGVHWPGDETEPGASSLYEYARTGNRAPLLVGVSGGAGSTTLIGRCGTKLSLGRKAGLAGDVSEDGDTVYFTVLPCNPSPVVQELYARVDNGQPTAHTVAVSEPSKEDCSECDTAASARREADAVGLSKDGSKEFFTTTQSLLGKDESNNLYEYDFQGEAGHRIVHVSAGDATVEDPTANVEQILSVSPDGSHVYFTASGLLTRVPNSLGQQAKEGSSNLYLYERDAQDPAGRIVFVLPGADLTEGAGPEERAKASQSGRFLGFYSFAHLTPDDLSSVAQAFEYDSQSGGFVRVSIGQDGFNSDGNTGSVRNLRVANDGSAYFETTNPLVAQAVNGGYDVYEYRAGSVALISSGEDTRAEEPGELAYVSPSGRDVFFTTFDELVPRDTDSQEDFYDARAGGGFSEPPPAPPPCQADACQGPLAGAPVLLSPGSEFQAGGENPTSNATEKSPAVKSKPKAKSKPKKKANEHRRRRARKAGRDRRGTGGIGGRR
jgi:hypothetical protein